MLGAIMLPLVNKDFGEYVVPMFVSELRSKES